MKKSFFCIILFLFLFDLLNAQDPIEIPFLTHHITFDGMPDESSWQDARVLPLVMQSPYTGRKPSEKSEVKIGWDQDYLYFAAYFYDRDPSGIRMPSMKRDENNFSNDWFCIILDQFNDKENGVLFGTTPSGLRLDFTISNDAQPKGSDIPLNFDWNTFWDARTRITNAGWFSEIRIPVSSLRFQNIDNKVTMGLTVMRAIARKNETDSYPLILQQWGFWSIFKPSQTQEIVFKGLRGKKPLYIAPYLLGGWQQEHTLNTAGDAYQSSQEPKFQAGGDIKYGLSSNLAMDITINPDFAQVEADDQLINLTRFSLFYPEKRLFFQERSSNFDFNFEDYNRLFYTRRIGLEQGEQIPIYGGIRVVGRAGPWDIGFLDMQTAASGNLGLPSQNSGILRLRRRVINDNTYIGGILTSKLGMNGTYNTNYGIDGIFNLFGDDFLNVMWAQTFENGYDNNPFSLVPSRMRVAWERRTEKGLGYNIGFSRAGTDYDPELGFELRKNYTQLRSNVWYGWFPGDSSKLLRHKFFLNSTLVQQNATHHTETALLSPGWYFMSKASLEGYFQLNLNYENVSDTFYIAKNTYIPSGTYSFLNSTIVFDTPGNRALVLENQVTAGQYYDGTLVSANFSPIWNASPKLRLSGSYVYVTGWFNRQNQNFQSHIGRLKILIMPSTKLSLSSFIQYNNNGNTLVANVRFRYNPREGNDLYVVYNDILNTNRNTEIPMLPFSSTRALLVKYTYTFKMEIK